MVALKNGSGTWFQRVSWRPLKLTGAHYDAHTRWPAGFDPAKAGAIKVRQ
jgi:peptide methionine sulfoxide reductase MsrB